MAEVDKESKTHDATPKRIEDARLKGNTPFARDLAPITILVVVGCFAPLAAVHLSAQLAPQLRMLLEKLDEVVLETPQEVINVLWNVAWWGMVATSPILLCLLVFGVLAAGMQNKPEFILYRIQPKASRISLSQGWQRIGSRQALVEFGKSAAKLTLVCITVYFISNSLILRLAESVHLPASAIPAMLSGEVTRLFLTCSICFIGIAVFDLLWSRFKWRSDLRMSHQELKEEHKQMEGDPAVRARQRSIAMERSRRRMLASVPKANVVVVNPTHFAVAMRYVHGDTAVPLVLAKGVDHLALRIRSVAEEHDIPIVEDKALARSLYEVVKTDRPIPPEFYKAVAEVILFLMTRQKARLARG